MNVSLTPELEQYVNDKVKSGMYNSASEVVRESLRKLKQEDELREMELAELRKDIQVAFDELKAGKGVKIGEVAKHLNQRRIKKK